MSANPKVCCMCSKNLILDSRYYRIETGEYRSSGANLVDGVLIGGRQLLFHPMCFQQVAGEDYCQELANEKRYDGDSQATKAWNNSNQPCKDCGALLGTFPERGFNRCNACGYPNQ